MTSRSHVCTQSSITPQRLENSFAASLGMIIGCGGCNRKMISCALERSRCVLESSLCVSERSRSREATRLLSLWHSFCVDFRISSTNFAVSLDGEAARPALSSSVCFLSFSTFCFSAIRCWYEPLVAVPFCPCLGTSVQICVRSCVCMRPSTFGSYLRLRNIHQPEPHHNLHPHALYPGSCRAHQRGLFRGGGLIYSGSFADLV